MTPLQVRVDSEFKLEVGSLICDSELLRLRPPQHSMFDQLCTYLRYASLPEKVPRVLSAWVIGIGTTALCLRWGSYLAFIWDGDKPLDPRVHDSAASLISDGEMARINIEASSNLAKLLSLQHEKPEEFNRLLWAAYTILPMPWRKVKPARDVTVKLLQAGLAVPAKVVEQFLGAGNLPKEICARPMRAYANVLVNSFWRNNSPVEDLHAGWVPVRSLTRRRAAPNQVNGVLRFVSEGFSAMLGGALPWEKQVATSLPWPACVRSLYAIPGSGPSGWSFTEECREVLLTRDDMEKTPLLAATESGQSAQPEG